MNRACFITLALGAVAPTALAQWVTFQNETATRLVAPANLSVNDNIEKSFVKGDFDQDGDDDVAVGRKFPGSIQGGFRNLLLMNESGVLTDRTNEYATASDVPGDQGFLAKTNDRDIQAVDVNNDGWLDLVTSTTMSDQVDAILGQPRVYMNLGDDGNGNWLGFRFEDARIPVLKAANGSTANPRFCDFAAADVTGDGFVDLFFVDYDTPETSGTVCIDLNGDGDTADADECQQSPAETASKDYQNKLLINDGTGHFVDSTTTRMTSAQLASAFGNATFAADMNGDGLTDIVRINTLTGGQNVAILYPNNALGTTWTGPVQIYGNAPYHMAPADINNDGKLDLCVIDDSQDRFLINTGNNAQGQAQFTSYTISDSLSEFGNEPDWADLDNNGYMDLMVADVDADLPSFCPTTGRRAHIYRNVLSPGSVINGSSLDEQGQIIPNASLTATFELLPIDINNDGWQDLLIGRCAGLFVWMNQPPISISFAYPDGLPTYLVPDATTTVNVDTTILGGGNIVPGTALVYTSVNGGAFSSAPLADLGGGLYQASLPPVECGDTLEYYFSGDLSNGPIFNDPAGAPAVTFSATAIDRTEEVVNDDLEGSVAGWTITNTAVTTGAWVAVDPNGTALAGATAQPENAFSGTKCFVTGNGTVGGAASAADLDGGPTVLTSPIFSLDGQDGIISYARWFYCDDVGITGADSFVISLSNDGGANWTTVETVNTNAGAWVVHSFTAGSVLPTTATMQVRFSVSDNPNNSTTEAGVDAFKVDALVCDTTPPCPADLDGNGAVDGGDLGTLLSQFGSTGSADFNGDGTVDGADLGSLLSAWGPCAG